MSRLAEPLNLNDLTQEGAVFEVDADLVKDADANSGEEDEDPRDISEKKSQQSNKECIGIFDEDVYEEGEPFEIIASKMFDLLPNGKIKKRIIRKGAGEKPLDHAFVKINYNAYVEYEDQPFDSTYVRHRPFRFTVNDGRVLPGLDFAVQSMTLNEKSQFLIHPDYAYGKNFSLGRVPSNATVLFEVELIEIVNSGAAVTYEKLPENQQNLFSEVYKYCQALCERGKNSFVNHDYKKAIKDYNTAAARLSKPMLIAKDEIEKNRELALRLHTNLLICYTRNDEPRKGCANAQKIYDLTDNGELLKIPAKVYYNHAKCLRVLGEYDNAKTVLDKAYRLEPKNPEIANEMVNLENDRMEHRKKQEVFAKALVGKVHE